MPQPQSQSETPVFLMPSLFNQTVNLLLEAREYFEHEGKLHEAELQVMQRVLFATEMSRITLRLSCVMAWLSVQRAVCASQLTREEAAETYPLDGEEMCLASDVAAEHVLPRPMNYLLEESRMLYERVHRLNTMSKQQPTRH